MNEKRRKCLRDAISHLDMAATIIECAAAEEQTAHDALPDVFQYGDQGEKMEAAVSNLEQAVELINEASQYVSESID